MEGLAIARDESDHPMNSRMAFGLNSVIIHQATHEGRAQVVPSNPVEDPRKEETERNRKRRRTEDEGRMSTIRPPGRTEAVEMKRQGSLKTQQEGFLLWLGIKKKEEESLLKAGA